MGDYPKPHLPKAAAPAGTTRLPLGLFEGLDVIIWDRLLDDGAAIAVEADLAKGRFVVPQDCSLPILNRARAA
jgi:hypothetical protein